MFGVIHAVSDGFTYGQSFWMTVCSTIASIFTNVTLIVDLIRTPDFSKSGKQSNCCSERFTYVSASLSRQRSNP